MKAFIPFISLLCILLWTACSEKKQDDSKEVAEDQNEEKFDTTNLEADTEFAVEAADAGMLEVQAGSLALSKASSTKVKEFAQMMIDDHTKANEELKALATGKNITLPSAISDKHKKKYDDLAEKSGTDFDKAYADMMVKDHKDAVDMFKKAADKCKDQQIKAWAAEKIPALEQHLSTAENINKEIK
jgi:putative membrane protein